MPNPVLIGAVAVVGIFLVIALRILFRGPLKCPCGLLLVVFTLRRL